MVRPCTHFGFGPSGWLRPRPRRRLGVGLRAVLELVGHPLDSALEAAELLAQPAQVACRREVEHVKPLLRVALEALRDARPGTVHLRDEVEVRVAPHPLLDRLTDRALDALRPARATKAAPRRLFSDLESLTVQSGRTRRRPFRSSRRAAPAARRLDTREQLRQDARRPPSLDSFCEELSRRPRPEHVHRAAEDVEHLAGDPLCLVGAERDDDGRVVRRIERVEPAVVRGSSNAPPVMRVRAFGAMQFTVTP